MGHRWGNIVAGLLVVLTAAGCGGGRRVTESPGAIAAARLPAPTRVDSAFVLESGGAAPEDTTIAIAPGRSRVIIIRRAAPDNSLFAQLTIPSGATTTDSLRVTVRPRPGLYGIDLEVQGALAPGAQLTISYAVHFVAPAGARAHYGSDLELEKALFVAQVDPTGRLTFLPTSRPGSDLVRATLPGPGRFLVAAPRS